MPLDDKAFAAKLERVGSPEVQQQRIKFSHVVPDKALSPARVEAVREDLTEAAVRAIWEHPAYPRVARGLAEMGVPDRADNSLIAHALRDSFRIMSGLWSLYLSATPGGLTHTRFDALHQVAGEGGRARTHGTIAYLRFLGYIEPDEAAGGDGRERRYRPTARMREAFRQYFVEGLTAIAPVWPDAARMLPLMSDEDAYDEFTVQVGEGLVIAGLLAKMHSGPSVNDFSRRRSGMVMLWVLLLAAPPSEQWPSPDTFPIRIAELARRAGVSRAHLQRLLRDCEANGMMALDGAGHVRFRDLLRREVNTYNAMFVICLGATARNALARLDERAAATG